MVYKQNFMTVIYHNKCICSSICTKIHI